MYFYARKALAILVTGPLGRSLTALLVGLMSVVAPLGAAAKQDIRLAELCYGAIARVSQESGVPRDVLLAISLTETGRKMEGKMRPWPWTVNMEGKGVWFDTRDAALDYVRREFARGARSFDTGCFQINYKWHHQHFSSLEAMFDPYENTRYAAKFLTSLQKEFGSWTRAAGAYHSRTPKYATKYAKRFDRYRDYVAGRAEQIFAGNGSESLELVSTGAAKVGDGEGFVPVAFDLSRTTPLLSPRQSATGSLFQGGQTTPLLRATRGALF